MGYCRSSVSEAEKMARMEELAGGESLVRLVVDTVVLMVVEMVEKLMVVGIIW